MQVVNYRCGSVILLTYVAFGVVGILLKLSLKKHIAGLEQPLREEAIPTAAGKRLFRWDRLWRRSQTAVWLGLGLLLVLLCGR